MTRERLIHERIDEQQRRQVIIDYISNHKGCIFQNIVEGQTIIGRVKASRILKELKKDGIVIPHQSAKNKRDIKLFLNNDNPFVSLPTELKKFKKYYYPLIDRAAIFYSKEKMYALEVLAYCLVIFFELMRMSNYRALLLWSKQIKDTETLSKLFKIFYSEMANLHIEVLGKFQPVLKEKGLEDEFLSVARDVANELLIPDDYHFDKLEDTFEHYHLKKKATPVLKHLLRVRKKIFASQLYTKEEQYEEKRKNLIIRELKSQKYEIMDI